MNENLKNIAKTLSEGEHFECGTYSELTITEFSDEFLRVVNGYKVNGGDVYILQTLGLREVRFNLSERNTAHDFFMYCLKVCK